MHAPAEALVEGCATFPLGDLGEPILLVTGPPLGAAVFRQVQERMKPRRTLAVDLIAREADADLPGLLARVVAATGARVVCAHGLAVPVALSLTPAQAPRLVLSNGPIGGLDPVSARLAEIPENLFKVLMSPVLFQRWLWSSLGMRRLVANPYVMDRDTVVALSQPWVGNPEGRLASVRWIKALRTPPPIPARASGEFAAIWGDSDRLYPLRCLQSGELRAAPGSVQVIPGGRHYHVLERPWAFADALNVVLQGWGTREP